MHLTEQDILKRVRQIEIKTRGLSDDIFAGKYHSAFRGRGMSFAEVREYRIGDDVRDIDWNVTARSERAHVKVYEEERELTMMLVVDVSPSRMFGTEELTKKNLITEIAATLAFSASKNNDKVGCILFSDRVEKFIPPKKGRSHILAIIRELVGFESTGTTTNISEALRYLVGVNKKRTTTFLLSDLIDSPGDMSKLEDALKIASSKHDIMAIEVFDKCDSELPDVGIIEVRDAETGATEWLDTSSRKVRDFWREQYTERREKMQSLLRHNRIDFASVATNGDYVAELIKMFKQR
jgi:uncharacterized protein (DUF58 family)